MSAKIQHFLANIVPLLKAIVWELCYIFTTSVSVFVREKVTINKNVGFTDYPYRIRLLDYSKLAINRKNDITQFSDITPLSVFFDVVLFLLLRLVTGPSFMPTLLLLPDSWKFSFVRDWPEIWKSEILPSEFCPVSGDWGKLNIPSLAWMSLMKCY